MAYATDYDIKKYLKIEDPAHPSFVFLLDKTTSVIDNIIGDVSYGEKEELIEMRAILSSWDILLRHQNVESIVEIGGKEYEGEKNKDFFILRPQSRKVRILNLQNYLWELYTSGVFPIKYVAGYKMTEVPEAIRLAQCLMVAYHYAKDDGKDIRKYVMWPRTVEYGNADALMRDATKLLNPYRQLNLLP